MKKPVILKNDVVLVTSAIIFSTVGMFAAYRFGRKAEIDEIIDIVKDQGGMVFNFYKKGQDLIKVSMELVEGD